MPVRLKLARIGVRNSPFYNVVAIRSNKPPRAKPIEELGTFDPIPKWQRAATTSILQPLPEPEYQKNLTVNRERIAYWLSVGAQASPSVANLLRIAGVKIPQSKRKAKAKAFLKQTSQSSSAASNTT